MGGGDILIRGGTLVDSLVALGMVNQGELDEFLDIQMVGTFHSKSPANYAHYASEEMDRLVMAGRTAATREERAKHY